MRQKPARKYRNRTAVLFVLVAVFILLPQRSAAWGANGQKLVVNKAIDTLPQDLRAFFDSNRGYLLLHVTDPLEAIPKTPAEKRNHYLYLDKYGRFPFELLPRSYKAAVAKYGKSKIDSNGLLPWEIGVYSQKLTEAMKAGRWDEAKLDAAILAAYVAQSHDPFNTTENFDGRLSGQKGVNERFGTSHAFESCLSSHSWIENILLADRNARQGENTYTDDYYDRFYNQAAATLIRQLSEAAMDVGSYWLTAWKNAGSPLPPR